MKPFIRSGMAIHLLNDGELLFQEELKAEIIQGNKIHALRLELDLNQLFLFVEWVKDKESSQYLLHTFHFSSEKCKTASLSEHSSGNNPTKYLDRIGLVKELKSIFVEKNF